MTALSIHLSEKIAQASQKMAKQLGISRTQFIRQAIQHELERLEKKNIIDAMAKDLAALAKNPDYLKEAKELDEGFSEPTLDDEDEWWK